MNNTELNKLIHSISATGQSFHSYQALLNDKKYSMREDVWRKKLSDICRECAKNCLDIRNLLIEGVKDDT